MLTTIEIDTSKINEHINNLNNSNRDQWLENVKGLLTVVSKCINGERYMEAAQLIFAVITTSTAIFVNYV
jgi:hypothetical protein